MRVLVLMVLACVAASSAPTAPTPSLLLHGTVVTMDDAHDVVSDGNVLVRDGKIVAVWSGAPPPGVSTEAARTVSAGDAA